MSKRFKGKVCVYCAVPGASETGDHVFAREFFALDDRQNLPKVPACLACNGTKSALEHYLTTVLPFGGRHADAKTVLNDFVPDRLAKNAKLHRELSNRRPYALIEVDGLYYVERTLPFQSEKLDALFVYIAKGLAYHHWKQVIPAEANVFAGSIHPKGTPEFEAVLAMNGRRVKQTVGKGVFEYEGLQSEADPHVTVWKFKSYGGAAFGDAEGAPGHLIDAIWATTSLANLGAIIRGEADEAAHFAAANMGSPKPAP